MKLEDYMPYIIFYEKNKEEITTLLNPHNIPTLNKLYLKKIVFRQNNKLLGYLNLCPNNKIRFLKCEHMQDVERFFDLKTNDKEETNQIIRKCWEEINDPN